MPMIYGKPPVLEVMQFVLRPMKDMNLAPTFQMMDNGLPFLLNMGGMLMFILSPQPEVPLKD